MAASFNPAERAALATEMTQTILDDQSFVFASHLKMSIVSYEELMAWWHILPTTTRLQLTWMLKSSNCSKIEKLLTVCAVNERTC